MAKLTLTDLANLQNETTAVNAINANSALIETAMENTLSRDGTHPNQMGASLDMNSNKILNLPAPIALTEPLRLQDLEDFLDGDFSINALPAGGSTGQILTKLSGMDYDADWEAASGITPNTVALSDLVQGAAKSFVGVTGNATANHADITGSANQIPIINSANTALAFTSLSGDVTNSSGAVTIANNAVTNAKAAQMAAHTIKGNTTGSTANATDFTIDGLTDKASPDGADEVILWDVAGSAIKKATVSSISAGGAVSTIDGQAGVVTTGIFHQQFDANGTYTPTTDMVSCIIEAWGGGGGGGGTAGGGSGYSTGGGGGGAGGYSRKYCTAADIGASKAVTIGGAGTGGSAGNNAGNAGGDSSVGALCIAKGGSGGSGNSGSASIASGGLGGVAGTGDITGVGMAGQSMVAIAIGMPWGGAGGSTLIGSGGLSTVDGGPSNHTGNAALGYGGGGAGGVSYAFASTAAGGSGASGLIIITEYVVTS